VKPQNVLVDPEGRAKVTDFGIARSLEAKGLTATGRVLGTTDYVSPEQALGHAVTEQSDVYSLGIVLYEMLTGEVPFKGDTQVAVAMRHVREPLPDVQKLRPEISAALASVIERATAKETKNRYATANEMVHDLEQVLAIEAARAGETSGEATTVLRALPGDTAEVAPVRLRRPRRVVIASALVIGLVGGLIAYFATRAERGPGEGAVPQAGNLERVQLTSGAAEDYDPQGDQEESQGQTQFAIDGNPTTVWDTETYSGGFEGVGKDGVGLYVEAPAPAAARRLDLTTQTPGWQAEVYAAVDQVPEDIGGWTQVSGRTEVDETERIPLDAAGKEFRYYLVWIVELPEGNKVAIPELSLFR
jgi:serine/threonine-protein kinase